MRIDLKSLFGVNNIPRITGTISPEYPLKLDRPTYEILQILRISQLDKMTVIELLTKADYKNVN